MTTILTIFLTLAGQLLAVDVQVNSPGRCEALRREIVADLPPKPVLFHLAVANPDEAIVVNATCTTGV